MGRARWTTSQYEEGLQRIAAGQQEKPSRLKNKFGAKPKVYNGIKYHSSKEADYARTLDSLMTPHLPANERVAGWERQVTYKFAIDGVKICSYILDFRVTYADGHIRYVDVKGMKKGMVWNLFCIKQALMKVCHGINVETV